MGVLSSTETGMMYDALNLLGVYGKAERYWGGKKSQVAEEGSEGLSIEKEEG